MRRWIPTLAILFFVLNLVACDDDDCQTCPPPDIAPEPTLENVWPNEDGRQWTYDFRYRTHTDPLTAFTDSFTIDDVDSLLALDLPGSVVVEFEDVWRLRFDGTRTTESGETGQFLAGYLYVNIDGLRREIPSPFTSRTQKLLERTQSRSAVEFARRVNSVGGLMLDGDRAFTKDAELIGAYGDFSSGLLWKYLEANLDVGHTFRFALLAGSEPDLYLDVRIRDVRDLQTPRGTYPNTVSVDYFINNGILGGPEDDRTRSYTVGRIEYAPEVGPVYNVERFFGASESGDPGTHGGAESEYRLIGTTVEEPS